VHELSTRVARSVEIYKNHKHFANNDSLWRERTRACIEATASLVCCANAELAWFGGISKLLGDIGSVEKIRELSLAGTDELFVTRWTCLSLMAIRPIPAESQNVQIWVERAMRWFARKDDTGNDNSLTRAQKIDETLEEGGHCLTKLSMALTATEELEDPTIVDLKEIFRGHESELSELKQINIGADRLVDGETIDYEMSCVQNAINDHSHQIISQFPGFLDNFDLFYGAPIPFCRLNDPNKLQFIRPGKTLKSMCSPALTLRNILEGQSWDADAHKELQKDLVNSPFVLRGEVYAMQLQLWRLQDLHDGGGRGFTVELFFLALSQLLSTSSSKESHSALYTDTFRAITSDWSKHKNLLGTQRLLLVIAWSRRREFEEYYPAYVVDEFLLLLGNIFEGQTGPHIDIAKRQLESAHWYGPGRFGERVSRVLTRAQSLAS
jgi:hypothetical protein